MKKVLERLGWIIRKVSIDFAPLYFSIERNYVEFHLIRIRSNSYFGSLVCLQVGIPNKTYIQKLTLAEWDVLFLKQYLIRVREDLDEKNLWTMGNISYLERKKLEILNKIL